jgi:hypothetical protein
MISTGEFAASGAFSTVKLAKLGAADGAAEGNDVERSKSHSVLARSMTMGSSSITTASLYFNSSTATIVLSLRKWLTGRITGNAAVTPLAQHEVAKE